MDRFPFSTICAVLLYNSPDVWYNKENHIKGNPMKTILRIILWAAVIGWMGLIFSFSVETAAESTETSGGFISFFMERWIPGFTELSPPSRPRKSNP